MTSHTRAGRGVYVIPSPELISSHISLNVARQGRQQLAVSTTAQTVNRACLAPATDPAWKGGQEGVVLRILRHRKDCEAAQTCIPTALSYDFMGYKQMDKNTGKGPRTLAAM